MAKSGWPRRAILGFALLLAIGLLAWRWSHIPTDSPFLKPYDFVQYWAAGDLLLRGDDPYDAEQLLPVERYVGWVELDQAVLMWNPPWTIPLVLPLALFKPAIAQLIWFVVNLGILLACGDQLWLLFGGKPKHRWIAWGVTLLFSPTAFCLLMGQISAWLLLGVSGFAVQMRAKRPFVAGAFLALTAIKPHLFVLLGIVVLLDSLQNSALRRAILSAALLLFLSGLVPLIWNPEIWTHYLNAVQRPASATHVSMAQWDHPTAGFLLRQHIPGKPFWVQFLPLLVSVPVVAVYHWMRRKQWDWVNEIPRLVLLGAFTACYGAWAFDLVTLLPAVIWMAVVLARQNRAVGNGAAIVYCSLNLTALASLGRAYSQENFWLTPVTMVAYCVSMRGSKCSENPVEVV